MRRIALLLALVLVATVGVLAASLLAKNMETELRALSGVVQDAAGRPVSAVWIAREGVRDPAGGTRWLRTDVDGRFRLEGLPPGEVSLRVVPGDADLRAGQGVRAEAGATDLVVVVDPGPQLFARIPKFVPPCRDARWARLVWVDADGSATRHVRYAPIAPDGQVRFVRLPPDRPLELWADAGADRVVRAGDLHTGDATIDVATEPASSVRGRVRSADGLRGVEVVAEAYPGLRLASVAPTHEGAFLIGGLPAGTYRVAAYRSSGAVTVPRWKEVRAGAADVVLEVDGR